MNFSGFYIVRPKSCKTKKIEIKKNTYDLIDKHDQKTWYRSDIDFRNSLQNQNMCDHVQIHHSVHILKKESNKIKILSKKFLEKENLNLFLDHSSMYIVLPFWK